ncbi:MAG: AbrB/MazE/SpoVT family DNA-binding domain-containing protein [Nanoarchaeota archaeon]|nr:AbrB/MazE/SpoVT family DNA-binding domain-containing protein [Nanoarchaeota archaeon]
MQRKVSKIGPSTLMISLPTKWVKTYNIKKGDTLDIIEEGNKLTINNNQQKQQTSITINAEHLNTMFNRVLGGCYKKGYETIIIQFKDHQQLISLYPQVTKKSAWIGLEIIEQTETSITLKQISILQPEEYPNLLNRAFLFLIATADETVQATMTGNTEHLQHISERDPTQNKYCDICRRLLNKTTITNSNVHYYIVEQLERIGDIYRDLCKYLAEEKKNLKKSQELLKNVNSLLQAYYKLFYRFSMQGFEQFGNNYKTLQKNIQSTINKADKQEAQALNYVALIAEAIFDMNGALLINHLHTEHEQH